MMNGPDRSFDESGTPDGIRPHTHVRPEAQTYASRGDDSRRRLADSPYAAARARESGVVCEHRASERSQTELLQGDDMINAGNSTMHSYKAMRGNTGSQR